MIFHLNLFVPHWSGEAGLAVLGQQEDDHRTPECQEYVAYGVTDAIAKCRHTAFRHLLNCRKSWRRRASTRARSEENPWVHAKQKVPDH